MRDYRFDVVRVVCMTYLIAFFHLYGYVYTGTSTTIVYSASTAMAHACLGLFTFRFWLSVGQEILFRTTGK